MTRPIPLFAALLCALFTASLHADVKTTERATIKFEGMAPLEGAAEAGGDYITFRTAACFTPQQLNELHRAMIDFELCQPPKISS